MFDFPETNIEEINKIIRSLNTNKATGADGVAAKVAYIIDNNLFVIINNVCRSCFLQKPIFKKVIEQK